MSPQERSKQHRFNTSITPKGKMNKEVGKGCCWFLMRFKDYLHDFVKYFLFLLSTPHSSPKFLWQSKPNLHLQDKACNQVLTHRISSLLSLFQLGPSHPYFIPEFCSHSRKTLDIIPGAHIKEQQMVLLQRQGKLSSLVQQETSQDIRSG